MSMILLASCARTIKPSNTPISNISVIANHDTMLLGRTSKNKLLEIPYSRWFTKNYDGYKVDSNTAYLLKPLLQNKTIEIFLGTWCGDTKREVPKMLKILETTGMDTNSIHLIFVDHGETNSKQSPNGEEKGKFIHHVPTFIVYENDHELGRIVETPLESFEKDLVTIISALPYTPKYKALDYWHNKVTGKRSLMSIEKLTELAIKLKPIVKHSGELNTQGYVLLAAKNFNEAVNLFKINCIIFPTNANAFDSLGEAYYLVGDMNKAKEMYNKVLSLDAGNSNAKLMLDKLK